MIDFRPLEIELASAAGSHDGVRQRVNANALTDGLVAEHENVHAEMFSGTSDGFLLSALSQLASSSSPLKQSEKDRHRQSARNLLAASRDAHEIVATFICIHLHPENYSHWERQMTSQYRDWHNRIVHSIDPTAFQSRMILYWAVLNIGILTFRSGLLWKLKNENNLVIDSIQERYSANHRIEKILKSLHRKEDILVNIMKASIAKAAAKQKKPPWDPNRDDHWIRVVDTPLHFEASRELRIRLSQYSKVPSLKKELDLVASKWLASHLEKANIRIRLAFEASKEPYSTASNHFAGRISRKKQATKDLVPVSDDNFQLVINSISTSLLKIETLDEGPRWIVSVWQKSLQGPEPPQEVYCTQSDEYIRLLLEKDKGQTFAAGPRKGLLSVCIAVDKPFLLYQNLQKIWDQSDVRNILSFYWLGAWEELMDVIELKGMPPEGDALKYAHLYIHDFYDVKQETSSVMRVYVSPIAGPIFRVLSSVGSTHADRAERKRPSVHRDGNSLRIEKANLHLKHAAYDIVENLPEY